MLNLFDYEQAARERLPSAAWGYYAGGANDEVTLRENRAAFDRLSLRYRTMVDVSRRDMGTTVLGALVALPVLIAPTAMQRLAHDDGECATARAAQRMGTIMVVSTTATTACADVRAAASGAMWFQLYVYRDRGVTCALIEQAREAGYDAIMLTVDAPVLGRRERDIRLGFTLPPNLQIANAVNAGMGAVPDASAAASGLMLHFRDLHDPALTPKDIEWVRSVSGLPVVVKGIVRGDDARRAAEHGAAAVVVSNHGGRQLDTAVASIRALPEVVDALGSDAEVYLDGGVRRGTDVLKAIALGARAVLIGRPVIWGLAVGGEDGVADVLQLLRDELDLAMALAGAPTIADITRDLVYDDNAGNGPASSGSSNG
jgi:4-hydroxymandelate oxidase